jgi:hypothetical protein
MVPYVISVILTKFRINANLALAKFLHFEFWFWKSFWFFPIYKSLPSAIDNFAGLSSSKIFFNLEVRSLTSSDELPISAWVFTFCLKSCLGPKIQDFCLKIACNQMKPLYIVNSSTDWSSKSDFESEYFLCQE